MATGDEAIYETVVLLDYFSVLLELSSARQLFDTLHLDAFAFAYTVYSKLLGLKREEEIIEAVGVPYLIITANGVLREQLHKKKARRRAIVAPYPDVNVEAAARFWGMMGFEVAAEERILTASTDANLVDRRLQQLVVDAVVLTGTGMPWLTLLCEHKGVSVILSNQCLASNILAKFVVPGHDSNLCLSSVAAL